jgi:hypothetical protein
MYSSVVRNFCKTGQQVWKVWFQSSAPQSEGAVIASTSTEHIRCCEHVPRFYPNPTEWRKGRQNVGYFVKKNAALTAPVFTKLTQTLPSLSEDRLYSVPR